MTGPIVLPRGVPVSELSDPLGVLRAAGVVLSEEAERLDAIERAQWCLVRIDGTGERWRCRACGCKHAHFTLQCVERPFRGLRGGLLAYWRNTAVPDRDLSPKQRGARAALARSFGFEAPLPSLGDRHPQAARALATPETDFDFGAWVLGTIDPIPEAKARILASLINARSRHTAIRI